MKKYFVLAFALALGLSVLPSTSSAQSEPRHYLIYGQQIVDQTILAHKELLVIGFHVTAPGATENTIVASNIGRIGKKSDDDDLKAYNTGKPVGEPLKDQQKYEVLLPLLDASGKKIGVVGLVFHWAPGTDETQFVPKAIAIRDEMAKKIPSLDSLFNFVK